MTISLPRFWPALLFIVVTVALSSLQVGVAGAAAGELPDLYCTSTPQGDGSTIVFATMLDRDGDERESFSIRRNTDSGSKWVATKTEPRPGDGIEITTTDADAGFFVRYPVNGANEAPCTTSDPAGLPPVCTVEGGSIGSDAFWSVVVEPQDTTTDFTLFVNDEERESGNRGFTDPAGNDNVYFSLNQTAVPRLNIEVAPTNAKGNRADCGAVQTDLSGVSACDTLPSDFDDSRIWIDVDVDFPVPFTVEIDGVNVGTPAVIKFADHPLSYLEPAAYYAVPGPSGKTILRFEDGTGLVCTGINPPAGGGFSCTLTGDQLSWTDAGADNGKYHIRRDTGSTTTWERSVLGQSGPVDNADARYLVRFRINSESFNHYCD